MQAPAGQDLILSDLPLPLAVTVLCSVPEKQREASKGITVTSDNRAKLALNQGKAAVLVSLKSSRAFVDNFISLRFSVTLKSGQEVVAITKKFLVTDFKISWTNVLPDEFYKDSGGKFKMMNLYGLIRDKAGKPPIEHLRLKAQLSYENLKLVPNQNILGVAQCDHNRDEVYLCLCFMFYVANVHA